MRDRTKRTLTVVIENVTEAQEIALNDLFATWQMLGNLGSSRWTAFYADGDGDFRPRITVNGEKAKFTDLLDRKLMWKPDSVVAGSFERDAYKIDFDWVGGKLQEMEDGKSKDSENKES
jgi:hypothetical protein